MAEREFQITIDPAGKVEVHVAGFKGKSCLEALKWLEKAIGPSQERRLTHEFYEPDETVRFRLEQRQ